MKKAVLITLLGALVLLAGCSKDDMLSHETKDEKSKEAPGVHSGRVMCTDIEQLGLNCTSSSANINSAVTFTWNNTGLSYVFNRVYKSYIQIESDACGSAQTISIPIHLFTTSSYKMDKGRDEACFKYRIVVLGYDKGQLACESISSWQLFRY